MTKPFAPKPPNMKPIPPVTPEDDRPAICDLLSEHNDAVLEIKAAIQTNSLYNPKLHDDLWMLRFWLSHKSSSKNKAKALQSAIDAATETLEYRKKNNLDATDVRRSHWPVWDGPNGERITPELYVKYNTFMDKYSIVHCQLHKDRGLVGFVRLSGVQPAERFEGMTEEEEREAIMNWSEWRFQVLDAITRRTGRLTKHAMFIDLSGTGLKNISRKAAGREGKLNTMTQNVYPQVNGGFFMINMPKVIQVFIRLVRPLYPKRLLEKMDVVVTEDDVNRIYPRFAELSTIPESFRGTSASWPPKSGSQYADE